jgi:hypothetical protein
MMLVFLLLGIGIVAHGSPWLGGFLILAGIAFLGVKEDAQ